MSTIHQNIKFYANGDVECILLSGEYAVRNNGPGIASNVVLTITLPAGLSFATGMSAVDRGSFDEGTGEWTIGSMIAAETVDASFCFEITDDCLGPYQVNMEVTSDECECVFSNNTICYILEGTSCCDLADCTFVVDNLYTTDGTQDDAVRTWSGGGNELVMQSFTDVGIQGSGTLVFNFDTDMLSEISGTVSFDSGTGTYILLTSPPDDPTHTKGLVRNIATGGIETLTISYGSYVDDAAAAGGSVPVGGHYYNTTNGVMHTRMS
jgi:hypothetical protein